MTVIARIATAFGIVSSHSLFVSRPEETARVLDACVRGTLH